MPQCTKRKRSKGVDYEGGRMRRSTGSERRLLERSVGDRSEMSCYAQVAPALLSHTALLLAAYGGAGLVAGGAMFAWRDAPAVNEMWVHFPKEMHVATMLLPCLAVWLLALAQFGIAAASLRRNLLVIFAVSMLLLMAGEVGCLVWAGWRVFDRPSAVYALPPLQRLLRAVAPLLPQHVTEYPQEDAKPGDLVYVYLTIAALALLLILQLLAVSLALAATCARKRERTTDTLQRSNSMYYERAPGKNYVNVEWRE